MSSYFTNVGGSSGGSGGGPSSSVSVTNFPATQPVSIAGAVSTSPATTVAGSDSLANQTAQPTVATNMAYNGSTWERIRSSLVSVQTTFVGLLNTISMARYNATAPTLADGNVAPLQATSKGSLKAALVDYETVTFDLSTATGNAASTTVAGTAVTGLSNLTAVSIMATLTGVTGGSCDVYLQHSHDGTTWYDYAHYTQLAAAAAVTTQCYVPALNDKNTVVGKGTTGSPAVALAANAFVGGHPLDQMRAITVTGTGVSVGVTQTITLIGTRPRQ